jgi:hypothetical protein
MHPSPYCSYLDIRLFMFVSLIDFFRLAESTDTRAVTVSFIEIVVAGHPYSVSRNDHHFLLPENNLWIDVPLTGNDD